MYLFEEISRGGGQESVANWRSQERKGPSTIPRKREVGSRSVVISRDSSGSVVQDEAVRNLIKEALNTRDQAVMPKVSLLRPVAHEVIGETGVGLILKKEQVLGSDFYDLKWDAVDTNELKRVFDLLQSEAKKFWRGLRGLSGAELNRRAVYVGGIIGKRSVPEAVRQSNMAETNRQREFRLGGRQNRSEIPEAK